MYYHDNLSQNVRNAYLLGACVCLYEHKALEKKNTVGIKDSILLAFTVLCGVLTQYYFILFAGLTGLVFLVFKIKEKCGKDLIKYIIAAVVGAGLALCIYPYIISNVLGGNRGLSSLDMSALDMITVVTYFSTSFAPMFRFLQRICSSIRFGCSDFVQPQLSASEFISVL